MAESEPCVKHALLALSGSYVLDFSRSDKLRQLTNYHYATASKMISEGLARPQSHAVSNSNAIIAAVVLMEVDDVSRVRFCLPG